MTQAIDPPTTNPIPPERLEAYYDLINKLMGCPSGEEPGVLDAHLDLLDPGFINTLMQVATMMAHDDNQDGAKFLIFIARQLAIELGLYEQPEPATV
jgi:hypothetical protein